MNGSLNDRFKAFLAQLPSAESIDEIRLPPGFSEEKRADFFVEDRKVVVELKSLESDPEQKIHEEIAKHRHRDEFPLFYGEMEVNKVLKHLPDGQAIMQKMFEKISRSIEQSFRSADRQIKSTKSIFDLPDALGLLILLNEDLSVLSPEIVSQKVSLLLTRKEQNGSFHYKDVASVLVVFENYILKDQRGNKLQPSIGVDGPSAEGKVEFAAILDDIQHAWATYNKIPLLKGKTNRISDSDFMLLAEMEQQQEQSKPRHEIWRQRYRDAPYLRSLADDAVLSHGARLFSLMAPSFLKGGTKMPAESMAQFMEGWTHFLEEVRIRGLDLKRMPKLDLGGV